MASLRGGKTATVACILTVVIAAAALAAPVPKSEYVFVPRADDWASLHQGSDSVAGKLDRDGDFVQVFPGRSDRFNFLRGPFGRVLSVCPPYDLKARAPAYEYRSGRLIRGEQLGDGSFVPEVGSVIKMLSEYRVGDAQEPPIWNLPGFFVRKDFAERVGLKGNPWP
jgi:hypothetical protein